MWTHTHLRVKKLLQTNEFSCTIHSQRKVDNKTIAKKIRSESISFSKQIQRDIYGPILLNLHVKVKVQFFRDLMSDKPCFIRQ